MKPWAPYRVLYKIISLCISHHKIAISSKTDTKCDEYLQSQDYIELPIFPRRVLTTRLNNHFHSIERNTLQWRHNEHDSVSNHQFYGCWLNRLFRRMSKKTSELRDTGLCEGNSTVTGEFPTKRASTAENVSIWWRHHELNSHRFRSCFQ